MNDQPTFAPQAAAAQAQLAVIPPAFFMWASMYTVMFYVCGGMIAAMYDPR